MDRVHLEVVTWKGLEAGGTPLMRSAPEMRLVRCADTGRFAYFNQWRGRKRKSSWDSEGASGNLGTKLKREWRHWSTIHGWKDFEWTRKLMDSVKFPFRQTFFSFILWRIWLQVTGKIGFWLSSENVLSLWIRTKLRRLVNIGNRAPCSCYSELRWWSRLLECYIYSQSGKGKKEIDKYTFFRNKLLTNGEDREGLELVRN